MVAKVQISFLIMNAFAGGGTIRTTLNTASALAPRHDVEIVSVVRRRNVARLPMDSRIRLRVLVDSSPAGRKEERGRALPVLGSARDLAGRALTRIPSRLAHPRDRRYQVFSARTDLALVRYLRSARGVVIGTRPSLNLILARYASGEAVTVGQEHMHLDRHEAMYEQFRRCYPRLDALVTLTERDAQGYRRLLGEGARVEMIPNAVPELGPVHVEHATSRRQVVAAGRLTPQKSFGRLIKAFAHVHRAHPDWTLTIYGEGPERGRLERLVAETGLSEVVRLPGFTDQPYQRFAEADIFALSSRREGFPMVLLEAMGCGLPLVAFDIPTGPAEMVHDGQNGFLLPDGDIRGFAAAINRLIEDPAARTRMGRQGVTTAAKYARERIAARWEELLADLTRGRGRSPATSSR